MKFFRNAKHDSVVMELTRGNEGESAEYKEIKAGETDGAAEKHVPVVTQDGKKLTVEIGSVPHPMVPEHYIMWAAVETDLGGHWIELKPEDEPKAVFELQDGEKAKTAYIYCNLHGLWKTEV